MTKIKMNGLTITQHADGHYTCDDLAGMPQKFAETNSPEVLQGLIEQSVALLRAGAEKRYPSEEEKKATPEDVRREVGQELFDQEVGRLRQQTEKLSLFQQLLFWGSSSWWYYNLNFMGKVGIGGDEQDKWHEFKGKNFTKLLESALPESVKQTLSGMALRNTAERNGHFALLYGRDRSRGPQIRRIVTDTQLFELREVAGYTYLDITNDGQPIARCCCPRGGERAFFDGVHLMSHPQFQTCAPRTVVFDGGYKVNSTRCTIINGKLFELVDSDDAVAHTTGQWMGMVDFTSQQQAEAIKLSEESATKIKINQGQIFLGERELKPVGVFTPGRTVLLDSGFTWCDWSDFHETLYVRYDRVMVVDDKKEWLFQVKAEFGDEIPSLSLCHTSSAEKALEAILSSQPEAVLLDMHLTEEERFDGLWIGNQLAQANFPGQVLITSSYPDEFLRAMQKLIQMRTFAPGKNLEKVRKALVSSSS